ncbi:bifunctional phosphoserine phosphatase/homoserine phosphotransferase ThrH [Candidatus Pacearchaeota archaeon]|nr:bifunctional phosphoserine phosphatase/homoserine phosphotransferase ThrH [Candidatus Pacearchaeota archaeon]
MKIVCLDLEGVLLPEFWEEFAKETKIEKLMLTTRDVPDYDELMRMRLALLKENNLGISEVMQVVEKMEPLEGAKEFLDWLKERAQVVILTGTYYEYIMPLMKKLDYPFMCANSLEIKEGKIVGYKLREKDGKIEMINRFKEAGFETIAIGDSFNDLKMLHGANNGILFRAKEELVKKGSNLFSAKTYEELKKILEKII